MIFLDSSFIISYEIENDQNHNKAVILMSKIRRRMYGPPVISEYIFDEVSTLLLVKLKDLNKVVERCELIKGLDMFRVNELIFEQAWKIFKEQKNTKLSFTDCTIIATMKSKGIQNIATFDEDFKEIENINVIG